MKGIKAVLFDLSDTIISYRPDYTSVYLDRLLSLGIERKNIDIGSIDNTINEMICFASYQKWRKEVTADTDDLQRRIDRALLEKCVNFSMAYNIELEVNKLSSVPIPVQTPYFMDGVCDLIREISEHYKVGIVSNHIPWMYNFIKHSEIVRYLSCIVISEMVGLEKPDPEILRLAFKELSLRSAECCYIGDQATDVVCAKNAGCTSILIKDKDYVFPEYCRIYCEDIRISSINEVRSLF